MPVLLFAARDATATRDRPPTRHTGGFGEPSCQVCHWDQPANTGRGSVTIRGLPERYTPGAMYTFTVVVTQPKLAVAGFELSARFENGVQAGTLRAGPQEGGRMDITVDSAVAYAHHLYDGTLPIAPDSARWQLVWQAPERSEAVLFHVAANAANDDSSPLGDAIYTRTVRLDAGK